MIGYDDELRRHNEMLRRAAGVRPDDQVLDVGCGSGLTTRQAARAAHAGSALGVDISGAAVERARGLALAEGLGNVTFECADAQVHEFPGERFDLVISRFGGMFFGEPVAAFANIGRALRPGGRLVMLVWQAHERNEWSVAIRRSLGDHEESGEGAKCGGGTGLDPFSLGDPSTVEGILGAAGFGDIALVDVREPVFHGSDVDGALARVRRFSCTSEVLGRLDAAGVERAVGRLKETLSAHLGDDGVQFDSRAWLVTARRV
ncbi:methyltransferase domain-containing protein [Actinoplanes sp. NPDC051470]|uniref:class I SAM-dependent methyltransferase n=1 Tax=Actinoplanes sp. NPDC051470 TaxID=3157224 RepID=UPI00342C4E8C